MNKFIFSSIFIFFINLVYAQVLRQHRVDAQDTLESIAQRYGVHPEDIVLLNPEAKVQLNAGKLLVIPNPIQKKAFKTNEIQEVVSYKVHRVKKKETLYSIAKKYNVTVQAIKENNQQLFEVPLQFKDKIYIPKFKIRTVILTPKALRTYKVKPKEGKWRIAYKFGISVLELSLIHI